MQGQFKIFQRIEKMDDERLKDLGGGNYWKDLLDRITAMKKAPMPTATRNIFRHAELSSKMTEQANPPGPWSHPLQAPERKRDSKKGEDSRALRCGSPFVFPTIEKS